MWFTKTYFSLINFSTRFFIMNRKKKMTPNKLFKISNTNIVSFSGSNKSEIPSKNQFNPKTIDNRKNIIYLRKQWNHFSSNHNRGVNHSGY